MTKKSQSSILAEFRLSILAGLAILALTFFACSSDSNDPDPLTRIDPIPPNTISFSDIEYWVGSCSGSGCDSAMFIVQWNDGRDLDGLVWGYKWNSAETKYGIDMIKAIADADSRFYALLYEGSSYGTTVAGLGYDLNGNGIIKLVLSRDTINNPPNSSLDTILLPNSNRLFFADSIVPFDSLIYNSFDYYRSFDPTDHWQSGWNKKGYWAYWNDTTGNSKWVLSDFGVSSRVLENKSIDAWYFDINFNTYTCYQPGANCDGRTFFGNLNVEF